MGAGLGWGTWEGRGPSRSKGLTEPPPYLRSILSGLWGVRAQTGLSVHLPFCSAPPHPTPLRSSSIFILSIACVKTHDAFNGQFHLVSGCWPVATELPMEPVAFRRWEGGQGHQ